MPQVSITRHAHDLGAHHTVTGISLLKNRLICHRLVTTRPATSGVKRTEFEQLFPAATAAPASRRDGIPALPRESAFGAFSRQTSYSSAPSLYRQYSLSRLLFCRPGCESARLSTSLILLAARVSCSLSLNHSVHWCWQADYFNTAKRQAMGDIHIDDFYRDVAKIFIRLYASFPVRSTLYVDDISGPDEPDEFGLHHPRYVACFSAMTWLAQNDYLIFEDTIRCDALDQVVLTRKGFLLLCSPSQLHFAPAPEPPVAPSIEDEARSNIAQLRAALSEHSSVSLKRCVTYLLSLPDVGGAT